MFNPYQDQIKLLEAELKQAQVLATDPEMRALAEAEIARISQQLKSVRQAATEYENNLAQTQAPDAIKTNCTLEFRSGAGGDEAKIWATDLERMYVRFADQLGLKVSYIDEGVLKISGKTTQLAEIHPDEQSFITAYQLLQYESGVHRVQRVPETESQGRIHTSTASVAVVPEVPVTAVEIRDEDLEWQFMRASGAGGQSVNKTSSAVRLTHLPTGIVTTSKQEKKQEQNRKIALEHLRSQLWEIEEEKKLAAEGAARSAIGRNRRSEKIRTYNYPQNRVTDHRTKQSWYNLPALLEGNLTELITALHPEIIRLETEEA